MVLLEDDEDYKDVDADTLYTMSVMVERPKIWEEREKYLKKDEVSYNMCLAFDQIEAEEREKGRKEGREEGREEGTLSTIAGNIEALMNNLHLSLEEACAALNTTVATYNKAKHI